MRRVALGAIVCLVGAAFTVGTPRAISEPPIDTASEPPEATPIVSDDDDEPEKQRATTKPRPKKEPRGPRTLTIGVKGPDVRELQKALTTATYDPGPADGSFGYMTQHAVFAFEKINELEPDGIVPPREARLIARARPPRASGPGSYVDIDITRQVLVEVNDGRVVHTLPVSTANGATYESRSGLATAYTPRGEFQIYSKTTGWRESYLGSLYNPSYFYGGYAIHGSASVPPYPASHGCVRIPMHSADDFFARNPTGTTVIVHD